MGACNKRYYHTCGKCRSMYWSQEIDDRYCFKCKEDVYILNINGVSCGVVLFYHDFKEVFIGADTSYGAFGSGFYDARDARLNLSQFFQVRSKIPWIVLSDKIRGYKIKLYKILVEDDDDIRFKEWFESLECTFQ